MKVALVGSSGYIAGFLLKRFKKEEQIHDVLKIAKTDSADEFLDLQHPEAFNYRVLNEVDFIVYAAAISEPDRCAADFDYSWDINVTGTKYFIRQAIEKKCPVLFFSSDSVFGDIPGHIYNEYSETKSGTPYGRMKKAVEDEFKCSLYFKAIRLSYVTSAKDRFISYCLGCINRGEVAEIFHPFYRNCIVVSDVADVVCWMAMHWKEYKPFVLNVAGKELVSRVRIADELNRYFGNKLQYTIVQPGADFYKNRPSITQMESLYMQEYKILKDNTFTEKIKNELGDIELCM